MKKLLSLVLSLALLTACTTAQPPTPPEGDRAEFDAFTARLDQERSQNIIWNEEERALIHSLTRDRPELAEELTEEEVRDLLSKIDTEPRNFTKAEAEADVDTFFRVLRSAYGGYEYFGGDEVFLTMRDDVLERVFAEEVITRSKLSNVLGNALSTVIIDGHFTFHGKKVSKEHSEYMYYVPDLYFGETAGLDPEIVKQTIGPNGQLTYCFAALSRDGQDLPETAELSGQTVPLSWRQADFSPEPNPSYQRVEKGGLTVLKNGKLQANFINNASLERLARAGPDYRGLPVFAVDLRRNGGGNSVYARLWVESFAGQEANVKLAGGQKYSLPYQLAFQGKSQPLYTWNVELQDGVRISNESVIFVLVDRGTGSAAEMFASYLKIMDNVILVGSNTAGSKIYGNICSYELPNSRISFKMGTAFHFWETMENTESVGMSPDLWVNPPDALDAVVRLCDYYGLNQG